MIQHPQQHRDAMGSHSLQQEIQSTDKPSTTLVSPSQIVNTERTMSPLRLKRDRPLSSYTDDENEDNLNILVEDKENINLTVKQGIKPLLFIPHSSVNNIDDNDPYHHHNNNNHHHHHHHNNNDNNISTNYQDKLLLPNTSLTSRRRFLQKKSSITSLPLGNLHNSNNLTNTPLRSLSSSVRQKTKQLTRSMTEVVSKSSLTFFSNLHMVAKTADSGNNTNSDTDDDTDNNNNNNNSEEHNTLVFGDIDEADEYGISKGDGNEYGNGNKNDEEVQDDEKEAEKEEEEEDDEEDDDETDYDGDDTFDTINIASPIQRKPSQQALRMKSTSSFHTQRLQNTSNSPTRNNPTKMGIQNPRTSMRRFHSVCQTQQEIENFKLQEDNSHLKNTNIKTFTIESDVLPRINGEQMYKILSGQHSTDFDEYIIIDCRFDYEYEGGHLINAKNISTKEALEQKMFPNGNNFTVSSNFTSSASQSFKKKQLIIFHCEFSIFRGPLMAKHLRKCDRTLNQNSYPLLTYPDVVILEGGYKSFYTRYQGEFCEPRNYVEMKDLAFGKKCETSMHKVRKDSKFLTRAKSFNQFSMGDNGRAHNPAASFSLLSSSLEIWGGGSNSRVDGHPLHGRSNSYSNSKIIKRQKSWKVGGASASASASANASTGVGNGSNVFGNGIGKLQSPFTSEFNSRLARANTFSFDQPMCSTSSNPFVSSPMSSPNMPNFSLSTESLTPFKPSNAHNSTSVNSPNGADNFSSLNALTASANSTSSLKLNPFQPPQTSFRQHSSTSIFSHRKSVSSTVSVSSSSAVSLVSSPAMSSLQSGFNSGYNSGYNSTDSLALDNDTLDSDTAPINFTHENEYFERAEPNRARQSSNINNHGCSNGLSNASASNPPSLSLKAGKTSNFQFPKRRSQLSLAPTNITTSNLHYTAPPLVSSPLTYQDEYSMNLTLNSSGGVGASGNIGEGAFTIRGEGKALGGIIDPINETPLDVDIPVLCEESEGEKDE